MESVPRILRGQPKPVHDEAGRREPLWIVLSINPHVIALSKASLTFTRVNELRLFIGLVSCCRNWNLQYRHAAWLQHPTKFSHRLTVVWNVLKNVIADNQIEGLAGV